MGQAGAPQSASLDRLIGRSFGEFVLTEPLGSGAQGSVYLARQTSLAREAVVKLIRPPPDRAPEVTKRFLREARLASRLDHPFAAHIYAFGVEPDALWLAMERVRGTPLDLMLSRRGQMSLGQLLPLFDRICQVVGSAHDQGIIHRDLKPANIMVVHRAGRLLPKLIDLGLARVVVEPTEPGSSVGLARDDGATPGGVVLGPVGTPAYMAPEQWVDPTAVDRRTDVYALGVICYEALTGRLPFAGASLLKIAQAHARRAVPPLELDGAAALDPVLARAMAKRPEDRYPDALALAEALRAAAGAASEPDDLPTVGQEVLESIVALAPQPIAEAAAGLEAPRNAKALAVAVRKLGDAIAAYLGVVTLAARTGGGPGHADDSQRVRDLLGVLRRDGLDGLGWLELAVELTRPYAALASAHPVPALVSLCHPADHAPAAGVSAIRALVEAGAALPDAPTEEDARALIADLAARATAALQAVLVVCDQPLAVVRGADVELWSGRRRPNRKVVRSTTSADEAGAMLLDADGNATLALGPLIQILQPTPGADPECFMLAGPGRFGARLRAHPAGYERFDEDLWNWLDARVPLHQDRAAATVVPERSPYRGLAAFTATDTEFFYGREAEASAVANRVRGQTFLAVVGPSGAGKSSFVQAGVLPLLTGGRPTIVVRPGGSPTAALLERCRDHGIDLSGSPSAPGPELGRALRVAAETYDGLFLIVDQCEELLTLTSDPVERDRFAGLLATAAGDANSRVRVIITLRDDFLIRAQGIAPLRDLLGVGLQLLGTPDRSELTRIVVEPARRSGYEFEDPALVAEMVAAVADQPGALALLSFTASRLWDLRDQRLRRLTRQAYDSLGGVAGALAHHAEGTLAAMTGPERATVREAFRHLVTADGTRAVLRRADLTELLGAGSETAIESLINARLLVGSVGAGGHQEVELIHETLLVSWPRLVGWQKEDAANTRLRDQLRAAARQWHERGRPNGLLWRGDALAEIRLWRARDSGALTTLEQAFAGAAQAAEGRARRIGLTVLGAVVVGLSAALLFFVHLSRRAERAATVASQRLTAQYSEQGRQLLAAGRGLEAAAYLGEATSRGATDRATQLLVALAMTGIRRQLAVLPTDADVTVVRFAPDGQMLVTGTRDGQVQLWRTDGTRAATLTGHRGQIWSAMFSNDGHRLVTGDGEGQAILWRLPDGAAVARLAHEGRVRVVANAPDDSSFATADEGGAVTLWNRDGKVVHRLVGAREGLQFLAYADGGARLIGCGGGGVIHEWEVGSGRSLDPLAGEHRDRIMAAALGPGDTVIATADVAGRITLWDRRDRRPIATWTGHVDQVVALAFARGGSLMVSGSADGTARVWDVATGRPRLALDGGGPIQAVQVVDDATVITAGNGGVARQWDLDHGALIASFDGHTAPIFRADLSADGSRLATGGFDGTARLWRVGSGQLVSRLRPAAGEGRGVSYAPDGRMIAAWSDGASLILGTDGSVDRRLSESGPPLNCALFAPDGRVAITCGDDGIAHVWGADGAALASLRHDGPVLEAAFFGSSLVATASADRTVRLWELPSGRPRGVLRGHRDVVWAVGFSPDGSRIATGSDDGVLRIFDVATATLLLERPRESAINVATYAPDGATILVAMADGTSALVGAADGRPLRRFDSARQNIPAAEFTPDGALAVSVSHLGVAQISDVSTGAALWSFGGGDALDAVSFTRDARRLATIGAEGEIRVWELPALDGSPDALARELGCRIPFQLRDGGLTLRPLAPCDRPDAPATAQRR